MTANSAGRRSQNQHALDPFSCAPLLRAVEHWESERFYWALPLALVAGALAGLLESSFGSARDFLLVADFRRLAGMDETGTSPPNFPFLRDYASWLIALAITLTAVLVHRQWTLMKKCLPDLFENGAISHRPIPRWRAIHRILGIRRVAERRPDDGFNSVVDAANRWLSLVAKANALVVLAAAILVLLVIVHLRDNGIFEVLAPHPQSSGERQAWLSASYQSWWAGTDGLVGLAVYFAVGCFGVYIVLLQNLVGLACVYLGVSMPALLQFGANWKSSATNYGWLPLARMYRTVYQSLSLHLATLLMLFWFLGPDNFVWLRGLAVIWTVVFPLYTFVPAWAFRRAAKEACEREHTRLEDKKQRDIARDGLTDDEITEVRNSALAAQEAVAEAKTKIHPLGIDKRRIPAVFITWLLPIGSVIAGML